MEWMCPDTEKSVKNTREFTGRKVTRRKTAEVMQQSLSGRDTARALHYFFRSSAPGVLRGTDENSRLHCPGGQELRAR